jgi:hypothetical protein
VLLLGQLYITKFVRCDDCQGAFDANSLPELDLVGHEEIPDRGIVFIALLQWNASRTGMCDRDLAVDGPSLHY